MKNTKNLLSAVIIVALAGACTGSKEENQDTAAVSNLNYFGDTITADGATDASQVMEQLKNKDSLVLKVNGKITEVCQKKGCWMDIDLGNNQSMKVRFKDYAFFVPKDAAGKTAVFEGWAYNDTISVQELRHYAEDAGQSKEEIEKITSPEASISFEANGVIIK